MISRSLGLAVLAVACNYSFHSGLNGSSSSSSSTPSTSSNGDPAPAGSSPSSSPESPTSSSGEPARAAVSIPAGFTKVAAVAMPGGPAPKVTIVSPTPDEEFVGEGTKDPVDKFKNLECMQDAKKRSIKLSAENWSVKPGGQGVLVVVDGVYATTVHDLSKPIMLADLEPYERVDNDATFAVQGPMYECGHHWIAAVPTAANGQMLAVAPVVTWFFNRSVDYSTRDETKRDRDARLSRGLPVVNWPLIGSPYFGDSWRDVHDERDIGSGFVLANANHTVFDWAMATPPAACSMQLMHLTNSDFEDTAALPARGTVVLPPAYFAGLFMVDSTECGGMDAYRVSLYAKAPARASKKKYSWPVPGSAKQEDYWSSPEGQEQLRESSSHSSHATSGGGGGGGKCKSQCRLEAGQCRQSCKGAQCANQCNHAEKSCQAGC